MKLLYAEDEIEMSEAVTEILEFHNYIVDTVDNGKDALEYALTGQYDGIILDIMMPGLDGLQVLKRLRDAGCSVPVMLLTAKGELEHRVEGLDMGADDYLPKPFAMAELLARVRAMLRRKDNFTPDILKCGDFWLNMSNCSIGCGEKQMTLPKLEYKLMELLMLNQGIYLSTEDILVKVWGYDTDTELGIVWVYISYLRKRLQQLGAKVEIKAKRSIGYSLEAIDG